MITLKNISKKYGERNALNNLSAVFYEGDFITVIGGNGAGKSTLLNVIDSSIAPDSGELFIDLDKGSTNKKTIVGRVYQDINSGTSPGMTIKENFAMSFLRGKNISLRKGITNETVKRIIDILKLVQNDLLRKILVRDVDKYKQYFNKLDFVNRLDVKMESLSGGERQFLSVLMVLMTDIDLLLLDEHVASLDPIMGEIIMLLTAYIVEQKKYSTIMVTHNIEYAIQFGNRIIMLDQGEIVLDLSNEDKAKLTVKYIIDKYGFTKTKLH